MLELVALAIILGGFDCQGLNSSRPIVISTGNLTFSGEKQAFRYSFTLVGKPVVLPASAAGLTLNGGPVSVELEGKCNAMQCILLGTSAKGAKVLVTVTLAFDTGKLYAGRQLLRNSALPPGKTPLFIGGSGITLEQVDDVVRVFI